MSFLSARSFFSFFFFFLSARSTDVGIFFYYLKLSDYQACLCTSLGLYIIHDIPYNTYSNSSTVLGAVYHGTCLSYFKLLWFFSDIIKI